MKSKLNTFLSIATIALLAVVICLQVFSIRNKEDSTDYVEKTLSEQKQLSDYKKKIGKKYITVMNDKITKNDYSTSIIGDVTNNYKKRLAK